jgi:hypothetical protein
MTDSTELADPPIQIHRHHHAPPPLAVTERNCEAQGFSVRGWRKLCRSALAAGFPASEQSDGWTMLAADLAAYLRSRAAAAVPAPAAAEPEPATLDEELGLEVAPPRALRAVGGRRG